ncbi:hypothetical protein ANHYDRO_01040 [Anaerococcus hydrogenalis DSM 7454]|uniref:Uncharacterized protein n=1 Tax=Anaerococcus hydrogenalis DSM 7454 TaxID=561177 RepID=B6W8Y9_9FIRM|nr:hypothetical protein ANHYDRO_01040 [Anaerococcus hydrogenalis DSM 7454]
MEFANSFFNFYIKFETTLLNVVSTLMDGGKCIYKLSGVRLFLSDKFDITKHKNYKLLEDCDKKNVFDIEKYITRKGKAKINGNTVITRL